MKSLSSVGLGLSVVFGCLLLALVAEVYYLLWWKKRITNREIRIRNDCSNPMKELLYMFCWKRPSSSSLRHTQELYSSVRTNEAHEQEGQGHQTQTSKDFLFKPFGEDQHQQDLFVPPRFLFTIVEETKEDLESEDGKSRGKSLSDFLFVETPYLTPMASPSLFTPPLTPIMNQRRGFNPLFDESASDAEFNRIKSSPPPKFKFLQDAEEKLKRKLQEEGDEGNGNEMKGSFITVVVDN